MLLSFANALHFKLIMKSKAVGVQMKQTRSLEASTGTIPRVSERFDSKRVAALLPRFQSVRSYVRLIRSRAPELQPTDG